MKLRLIDGCVPVVTPASPCRPAPRVGDHALGVHRALWRAGAAGGVDQQAQRVGIIGGTALRGRQFGPTRDDVAEHLDGRLASCLRQARFRGGDGVTVVVDLRPVVEHDQPGRLRPGQNQFDGVGEVVDAGGDGGRLGLGHDRQQLCDGCAGLQRHRNRAEPDQRHVEAGVVDAGEAEQGDAVTRADRIVGQRAGDRVYAVGKLAVGDGLVAGEQFCRRSGRCRGRCVNSTARAPSAGRSA